MAGVAISGKVVAAGVPDLGAQIQLYAAGSSGNGSAPTPLLSTPMLTASDGSFNIPAGYRCPSSGALLYVVANGGQVGSSAAANPALRLMTVLGACNAIAAQSVHAVSEATTVAAVWAFSPFLSSGGNLGASCTNAGGLQNAFVDFAHLVNTVSGTSPGPSVPSTLSVPTAKLNSLANILASCSASTASGNCASLWKAAATGSAQPSNTLDAALNIARAPGANVSDLFALAGATPFYLPGLASAPPDWMLANTVSGGGLSGPASIGISATGEIWVGNYFNAISQFAPDNSTGFPAGISGSGINQTYGLALDPQGNVWIANEQTAPNSGTGNIAKLNPTGQTLASGITSGGINYPIAAAADTNGNMWFANYGTSTVSLLSAAGNAISPSSGWGAQSLAYPVALAVDSGNNAWVASQGGLLPITRISPDGSKIDTFNCDCNGASGVAMDASNHAWIANYYGNSVSKVDSCGVLQLDAITGGGLNHPQAIAIDGAGNAWVANFLGNSLTEISGSSDAKQGTFASPITGFGIDQSLSHPYGLAIDASGAVWVSNAGKNTLTQFIGIAAPVKTPMIGPPQAP